MISYMVLIVISSIDQCIILKLVIHIISDNKRVIEVCSRVVRIRVDLKSSIAALINIKNVSF